MQSFSGDLSELFLGPGLFTWALNSRLQVFDGVQKADGVQMNANFNQSGRPGKNGNVTFRQFGTPGKFEGRNL